MRLVASILAWIALSSSASAQRLSVQVSHYELGNKTTLEEWVRIDREHATAVETAKSKRAANVIAFPSGDELRAVRALEAERDARHLGLLAGHEADLVQECVVSAGQRMAQHAWQPRGKADDGLVMHVLVEKFDGRLATLDLIAAPESRANPQPFSWEYSNRGTWPVEVPALISWSGFGAAPDPGLQSLNVQVLLIRPIASGSENRCFPARYGNALRPPD